MIKNIEVSGKTLDVAIEKGLKELGLESKEQVNVKVLKDNGFLFNKFKIQMSKKLTEGEAALSFMEKLIEKMGFNFVVEMQEDDNSIVLNLIGTDSANIIGYRGEVLDAIQYICSLVVNHDKESYKRLLIDTEGYRNKREETLVQLAHNLESKVKRTGRTVKLEPMNPYERRIIHSALQESEFVTTVSEGLNPMRYVTIVPKSNVVRTERRFDNHNNIGKPSKTGFKGNQESSSNYRRETVETATDITTVDNTQPQLKPLNTKSSMNFVYSSERKRKRNSNPLNK